MPVKKTDDDAEIQACHHLRHQVEALAGNSLTGPMKWYTALHCSYCNQCGTALRTLRNARESEPEPDVTPL
jgi:hypothetical protein